MPSRKNIGTANNLCLIVLIVGALIRPASLNAAEVTNTKGTTVTASIDDNRATIFGYTSPFTRVELSSPVAYAVTYSENDGSFLFDRTILPKNPGELCLTAIDDNDRRTTPVCIPPPPPVNYHTNIGPVLLPPTLTIDSQTIKPNSTTVASGQSLPLSTILVSLYQADPQPITFPKPALAFALPVFTVTSDAAGNYSFNLPTAYSSAYRLFSTVMFDDSSSPKSNTLTYTLPSLFWLLWIENSWLILGILFFIFTLVLFVYLIRSYYHRSPNRYLPALFSYPLQLRYER